MTPSPRRTHPATMVLFFRKSIYWLLLPLGRNVYAFFSGGLFSWGIAGVALDVLTAVALALLSYVQWRRFQYTVAQRHFLFGAGVIFRSQGRIPVSSLCAVESVGNPLVRLLGLRYISIDTAAKTKTRADVSFFVHHREAQVLLSLPENFPKTKKEKYPSIKAGLGRLLLLALLNSNSLIGILLVAGFFLEGSRYLGHRLTHSAMESFTFLSQQLQIGVERINDLLSIAYRLPLAGAYLALGLLLGWCVAFLAGCQRHFGLSVTRQRRSLLLESGLLWRRQTALPISSVVWLDLRQGLPARCLGLYTVFLCRQGDSRSRSRSLSLSGSMIPLPFSREADCRGGLELLLPEYLPFPAVVRPDKRGAVWGYVFAPLTVLVCVPPVWWLWQRWFPQWRDLAAMTGIVTGFLALWFLLVRFFAYRQAGVAVDHDVFVIRYSAGFSLHTTVFSRKHLLCLQTLQHPLQQLSGRCDLLFHVKGQRKKTFWVRNLPLEEAARFPYS